jgi:hypothetical protein
MGQKTGPLHVDADDDEAIELLKKLRDDPDVRADIESNPRQGLLTHLRIDFPNAPQSVTLPDPAAIDAFVQDLESEKTKGAQSKYANLSHGFILLYMSHGNGFASTESAD